MIREWRIVPTCKPGCQMDGRARSNLVGSTGRVWAAQARAITREGRVGSEACLASARQAILLRRSSGGKLAIAGADPWFPVLSLRLYS